MEGNRFKILIGFIPAPIILHPFSDINITRLIKCYSEDTVLWLKNSWTIATADIIHLIAVILPAGLATYCQSVRSNCFHNRSNWGHEPAWAGALICPSIIPNYIACCVDVYLEKFVSLRSRTRGILSHALAVYQNGLGEETCPLVCAQSWRLPLC